MSTAKPHRRLTLTQPTTGSEDGSPEELEPTYLESRVAALEARCAALNQVVEGLLRALEARDTVAAPFQVSDSHGRPLLKVEATETGASLRLFSAQGEALARLSVEQEGGRLEVRSPRGESTVLTPGSEGASGSVAPDESEEAPRIQVSVVSTGGGLDAGTAEPVQPPRTTISSTDVQIRQGQRSLADFHRSGRKAVAVYAEGLQGPVCVYDDGGGCVYSQQ